MVENAFAAFLMVIILLQGCSYDLSDVDLVEFLNTNGPPKGYENVQIAKYSFMLPTRLEKFGIISEIVNNKNYDFSNGPFVIDKKLYYGDKPYPTFSISAPQNIKGHLSYNLNTNGTVELMPEFKELIMKDGWFWVFYPGYDGGQQLYYLFNGRKCFLILSLDGDMGLRKEDYYHYSDTFFRSIRFNFSNSFIFVFL